MGNICAAFTRPTPPSVKDSRRPKESKRNWTVETAEKLQQSVDCVFGADGQSLLGLEFSFSIADPSIDGCPLIGCSTGFTKLCGYKLDEIVGRNCRFLVEPVPREQIDDNMRKHTKDFCESVRRGNDYWVPEEEWESWMPKGRPGDELIAMQKNLRKDGTAFNNMFLMKAVDLSNELGKERPYIIALQSDLPEGKQDLAKLAENITDLEARMRKVQSQLSSQFFIRSALSRQNHTYNYSAAPFQNPDEVVAQETPKNLHTAFDPASEVRDMSEFERKFKTLKQLSEATRNHGSVELIQDLQTNERYAVKKMPNTWVQRRHEDFVSRHPEECEMPWQDIGCAAFLNSVNFQYAMELEGVYRSKTHTYVVSELATEGDLFTAAMGGPSPGPDREKQMAPLIVEVLRAVQQLHDRGIVHRDISLENVLLTKVNGGSFAVKLIDFGMATTQRTFRDCRRGKASYEAPEMHDNAEFDAFLSDTFATGVVVYGLLLRDYPWMSTKPDRCKCFSFVRDLGFLSYCKNRKVRGTNMKVFDSISKDMMSLLHGMLIFDPASRLTLGEKHWTSKRKSILEEPWMLARK